MIASQGLLHARYGGVVPEIASRRHLELVDAVIADALERAGARLDELETVAVTQRPGPDRRPLVGLSSAKALAATRRLPLVPVDHLHGHVTASTLGPDGIEPPYLCLVASGGHTFLARVDEPASYSVLGQTLDDAAGEAFDKGARLLGLGYPGGPELDRLAREGDPEAFDVPAQRTRRARLQLLGTEDSAALPPARRARRRPRRPRRLLPAGDRGRAHGADRAALEREGLERLAIGGGVAANSELRAAVAKLGVPVWVPPPELCTDNAAMIAGAARFLEPIEYPGYLALDAAARLDAPERGVAFRLGPRPSRTPRSRDRAPPAAAPRRRSRPRCASR